jgi:threonine synthase
VAESGDNTITVVASTASPYKFAADVLCSLGGEKPADDLDALALLSEKTATEITLPLRGLAEREVRFDRVIDACDMAEEVFAYIEQ